MLRLAITLLTLISSTIASADLATKCLDDQLTVHMDIELQEDFWYYVPHPQYTPQDFCASPGQHITYLFNQPQPGGSYFSKIHFTLYPEESPHSYFVAAFREDSYDNQSYQRTETSSALLTPSETAAMELGGWFHFQRHNFKVTFSLK